MRANTKRILIETESHEVIVIHRNPSELHVAFCRECRRDSEMLTLDGAVGLSGRRGLELTRLVETGEVHSHETPNGYLLICLPSLEALVRSDVYLIDKRGVDDGA